MIYVISDLHGNREKFDSILSQIALTDNDTLYILGDIVDRGPDPIGILRQVMKMKNVKMLLGNHEHMMLQAYFSQCIPDEKERLVARWNRNGCDTTIKGLDELTEEERQEIFEFVNNLPLNFDIEVGGKNYLLVHGFPAELYEKIGPRLLPGCDLRTYAVWERMKKEDVMPEGKTVIFGHTSTSHYQEGEIARIWYGDRKIGIDCGGGYGDGGRISCLCLDDMKEYYA